jgi:hypothetical protein
LLARTRRLQRRKLSCSSGSSATPTARRVRRGVLIATELGRSLRRGSQSCLPAQWSWRWPCHGKSGAAGATHTDSLRCASMHNNGHGHATFSMSDRATEQLDLALMHEHPLASHRCRTKSLSYQLRRVCTVRSMAHTRILASRGIP